jgi:hypothetical protein
VRGKRALIILLTATILATTPATVFAQSAKFGMPAQLELAGHDAYQPQDDATGSGFDATLRHAVVGTAVLGGAFTLGFLATGSLSTAIGAASAVVITYAVLP